MGRCALVTITLGLVLSACSVGEPTTTTTPPVVEESPFDYGPGIKTSQEGQGPAEAGAPAASPKPGRLVVTLVDQNGGHPQGIPVTFSGPVSGKGESTSQGRILIEGPPGRYNLRVPAGCTGRLIVESGASGSAWMLAGQTAQGELAMEWQHRVAPGPGTYPSQTPYWHIGEVVHVSYDMYDRCANRKAPDAAYPTYIFEPSPNLEIVGTPEMRTDHNSKGHLDVRCLREGVVELWLVDSANPSDRTEMTQFVLDAYRVECRHAE